MEIIQVDPKLCKRWKFADRSIYDFGNIIELSQDILNHGQIEPVILRKTQEQDFPYEVIAGSRRLKACLEAEVPLKGIVQELSDEQAIVAQVRENQKIELSDYSKGINYSQILEDKKLSISRLASILGLSKSRLNRFLCFRKVPSKIWEAVSNPSKVSSRTAETINALAKKGEEYVNAIIDLAEEIRKGTGSTTLEKMVLEAVNGGTNTVQFEKTIALPSGQVIAKWTKGGLQFAKDIPLDQEHFEKMVIQYFTGAGI